MAIVGIETSDKMTDKQIVAMVRGSLQSEGAAASPEGLGQVRRARPKLLLE